MTQTSRGRLSIVGIGPGNDDHITPAALRAIQEAQFVIGYTTYIRLVRHHLTGKQVTRTGMTEEIGRARSAIETAAAGNTVTLISSGDAGVYGMAGLVFEVLREMGWKKGDSPEIQIIPGITAQNSCASLVGAPLIHDTCRISLSDLLTPWPVIEKRIEAAAQADFVITLYNPASGRRQRQIVEATRMIRQYRDGSTPVALIKSAYRKQQNVVLSDLDHFLDFEIGMNTTVLIGSSNTFVYEGYMVTPRGHTNKYRIEDGSVLEGQRKAKSLVCDGDLASKKAGEDLPQLHITKITHAFMRPTTEILSEEPPEWEEEKDLDTAEPVLAPIQDSKMARLAGAIIFHSGSEYYLVGDLKEPCCFEEFGFRDPLATPFLEGASERVHRLEVLDESRLKHLQWKYLLNCHGLEGAKEIYRRLAIYRNASVSERLLRLLQEQSGTVTQDGIDLIDVRWLNQTPETTWQIVRDQVLKCS